MSRRHLVRDAVLTALLLALLAACQLRTAEPTVSAPTEAAPAYRNIGARFTGGGVPSLGDGTLLYLQYDWRNTDWGIQYPEYGAIGSGIYFEWYRECETADCPSPQTILFLSQSADYWVQLDGGTWIKRPVALSLYVAGDTQDYTPSRVYESGDVPYETMPDGSRVGYRLEPTRDPSQSALGDCPPRSAPRYDDPDWQAAWLADLQTWLTNIKNGSYADQVYAIWLGLGVDGETQPAKNYSSMPLKGCYYGDELASRMGSDGWQSYLDFVELSMQTARTSFPSRPIFVQAATDPGAYWGRTLRDDVVVYANSIGVGYKPNGLTPDRANLWGYGTAEGKWLIDVMMPYSITMPIAFEPAFGPGGEDGSLTPPYPYGPPGHAKYLWWMLMQGLSRRPDLMDLQEGWFPIIQSNYPWMFKFIRRTLGKQPTDLDQIWTVFRQAECTPTWYNPPTNTNGVGCTPGPFTLGLSPSVVTGSDYVTQTVFSGNVLAQPYSRHAYKLAAGQAITLTVDADYQWYNQTPAANGGTAGFVLSVLALDSGTDLMYLDYTDNAGDVLTLTITKTNTALLKWRDFAVSGARWNGALDGADLRIRNDGTGTEYVVMAVIRYFYSPGGVCAQINGCEGIEGGALSEGSAATATATPTRTRMPTATPTSITPTSTPTPTPTGPTATPTPTFTGTPPTATATATPGLVVYEFMAYNDTLPETIYWTNVITYVGVGGGTYSIVTVPGYSGNAYRYNINASDSYGWVGTYWDSGALQTEGILDVHVSFTGTLPFDFLPSTFAGVYEEIATQAGGQLGQRQQWTLDRMGTSQGAIRLRCPMCMPTQDLEVRSSTTMGAWYHFTVHWEYKDGGTGYIRVYDDTSLKVDWTGGLNSSYDRWRYAMAGILGAHYFWDHNVYHTVDEVGACTSDPCAAQAQAAISPLVINEIGRHADEDWFMGGGVTEDDDFIELYNSTAVKQPLASYQLCVDDTCFTFARGEYVNAGQVKALFAGDTGLYLPLADAEICLYNYAGRVIDCATWSAMTTGARSIGRYPDGSAIWREFVCVTHGRINTYWDSVTCPSVPYVPTPTPTPTLTPTVTPTPAYTQELLSSRDTHILKDIETPDPYNMELYLDLGPAPALPYGEALVWFVLPTVTPENLERAELLFQVKTLYMPMILRIHGLGIDADDSATWRYASSTGTPTPWATPGAQPDVDYYGTPVATVQIASTGAYTVDITSLVQDWIDGSKLPIIILVPED